MNKSIDTALANPEVGIKPPSRKKSSSFTAQIEDLALGESCARVRQISPNARVADVQSKIVEWRADFRRSVDPSIAHAKRTTGAVYTTEVADFMTAAKSWFLVAVVTRVE